LRGSRRRRTRSVPCCWLGPLRSSFGSCFSCLNAMRF
jgi:hypothetical protein